MIEKLKDSNEKILWQGKPSRFVFAIGNPFFYVFAALWGAFDYLFIKNFFSLGGGAYQGSFFEGFSPFFYIFFVIHLAPVWIAIFLPIYRFLSWKNVEYALSDKRIYLISGLFGKDIISIEHRDINNLIVDVNFIENSMNLGTLILKSPMSENERNRNKFAFKNIKDPYDVYNLVKKVSLDVYTDQQYPNKLRPSENTGYNTEYTGNYKEK